MIKISHEENNVVIQATLTVKYDLNFRLERNSILDAILLKNQIQKDLDARIEKIRKDAYNLGWKDAKSKREKKKRNFCDNINQEFIGY